MIPIDQVDDLIRAVADENNLELASLLPEIAQGNFPLLIETLIFISAFPTEVCQARV